MKINNKEFKIEQAAYDLSLIYAREKFADALKRGKFDDAIMPKGVAEREYLQKKFLIALDAFTQMDDSSVEAAILSYRSNPEDDERQRTKSFSLIP